MTGRSAVTNVTVAFLASMFAATIFLAFGVLLDSLMDKLKISTTEAAMIHAAQWFAFGAASWVLGIYSDRIGTIASIRLGFLLILGGLLLAAVSLSYVTYVVGFGLMTGAGLSASFGPLHNLILSTTQDKWKGTALGVVMAAQGIGPVVFVPLISALVESRGIRTVIFSLLVVSLVLVLLSFFLRDSPSHDEERRQAKKEPKQGVRGLFGKESGAYEAPNIKATFAHLLGCASHTVPLVFVVELARASGGFSPVKAASVVSVISAASIITRLLAPVVGNVVGAVPVLLATLPLQLVGLLLFILFSNDSLALYYVAAFVFGLGFGSEMVLFSLVGRQVFEGKIGGILGVQLLGAGLGMGGGVVVGGIMLTAGLSYEAVFWVALVFGIFAELVTYVLRRATAEREAAAVAGGK